MSQDWYLAQGTRFVYTAELRNNGFSFMLPADQIRPSGEEFWEAFKVGTVNSGYVNSISRSLSPVSFFPLQYILNKVIEVRGLPYRRGGPEANARQIGVSRPIFFHYTKR